MSEMEEKSDFNDLFILDEDDEPEQPDNALVRECALTIAKLQSENIALKNENESLKVKLKRIDLIIAKVDFRPPKIKLLPCKCGSVKRDQRVCTDGTYGIVCRRCGFEVWAVGERSVQEEWNKAVT